ncbi:MAG: OmpA family protein [Nitrospirales bacterium]
MRMRNWFQVFIVMIWCTSVLGCVSQRSHEQALQELEMTKDGTAQEVERLTKTVEAREVEIAQLQETKKELEQTVEVQEQIKEQQLANVKKELETLYAQVLGFTNQQGGSSSVPKMFGTGSVDFDDLGKAFQHVRVSLDAQVAEFSQLREQNRILGQELSSLENRLKEIERLKKELEQVRKSREAQEAQLAKVKHEVLAVGDEIERITKALEEKFGKSLVVTQHQDRLVLTMLGQVLFESGEAELTPLGLKIMKQVGQVLASLPEKYIQVEGHTDNNPIYGQLQKRYPTNWELSTARATTVLRYLIEQTGMNRSQFSATGYADTQPVQSNETEDGRAQNRRVEIVLYPEQIRPESEKVATLTP